MFNQTVKYERKLAKSEAEVDKLETQLHYLQAEYGNRGLTIEEQTKSLSKYQRMYYKDRLVIILLFVSNLYLIYQAVSCHIF